MSIVDLFKENNFNTDGEIDRVELNIKDRTLDISLKTSSEIMADDIRQMQFKLVSAYGLNRAHITVKGEDMAINDAEPEPLPQEPCNAQPSEYEEFKREREMEFDKQLSMPGKDKHIYGDKIKSKKISEISSVTDVSGSMVICGTLFELELKELRGGRMLFAFNVHDKSGSVSCKIISMSTPDNERLTARLKKGMTYLIKGEGVYDKYAREIVFMVKALEETEPVKIRMDNASEKRVELHLHTQMSQMDAMSSAKDLINRAYKWGHKAVAITDHGVVQAFPFAMDASRKLDNFKVIYGTEGYLIDDFDDFESMKKLKPYHICILVKNQIGLKNLYTIISESHLKYFHKRPRIPRSLLEKYKEGLILGSACEAGELYKAILADESEEKINQIASFYDYFEIMPLGNNRFMIDNGTFKNKNDLIAVNKKIISIADSLNRPVVATGDVHFLDPEDSIYRAIVQAGQGFSDADNQAPLYFMTTDEMLDEFSYLGDELAHKVVIENTNMIADSIDKLLPIPDGTFPPEMENSEQEILDMCHAKAKSIYGDPLPDIVKERMDRELDSIIGNGYSVMYLIANKLVAKSNSDGYVVGSRGSVGSSFAAYLSNITEVNALPPHYVCPSCKHSEFILDGSVGSGVDMPDKLCPECGAKYIKDGYDIPFETFLGFNGDKEPDIDLNFSGDYQSTAHRYVGELFGEENVFKAGTICTLADKTAYGYVKKYLEERGKVVHNAEINRLVGECVGVKRTTGQHPAGMMILPKGHDIHEFCPVQYPADDKTKNVITTHFDYHSISGRLLKLDILGHDNPTIIRMLEDLTGVNPSNVPLDDKETLSLFSSTEALGVTPEQIGSEVGTYGIPEFGTSFVQKMLIETEPTTLSELIRISGLSHGTDVWTNNAQLLVNEGTATLSEVICTRDDIMLYLIYNGIPKKMAFTIMERVRKGKKLEPEHEAEMRANSIPEWYIESCNKIKYMFPKAHAVAYVTMAVQIAYFKVHYPEAFYLTYLTVRGELFDISTMHDEAIVNREIKRLESTEDKLTTKDKETLTLLQILREMFVRGFKFAEVDLYKSDPKKFLHTDDGILPPLMAVSGLGEAVAYAIADERKKAEFNSIEDLRYRTKLNKTITDFMKGYGCLDGMSESDQLTIFDL